MEYRTDDMKFKTKEYWESVEKNFWSKVDIRGEDDCWEWKRSKDKQGYGNFNYMDRPFHQVIIKAYRFSWMLKKGTIPKYLGNMKTVIRHLCNNKGCVNPNHLRLGTYRENAIDTHQAGKAIKLKPEDVRVIRVMYESGTPMRKIKLFYNVSEGTIRKAVRRIGYYYKSIE